MSQKEQNDNIEMEVLNMDEIVNSMEDLPSQSHNFLLNSIIPGILLPVINSLASPYYKKQLIEAQKEIASNKIIANERKYKAILDLIHDLAIHDKLSQSMEIILKEELQKCA